MIGVDRPDPNQKHTTAGPGTTERRNTMTISESLTPQNPAGRRSGDNGFTLVEILIAIVLVGILSAVVVVGISNLTSKGSASACSASLDASKAASTVYFASSGAFPTTFTQMVSNNALTLPTGTTVGGAGVTVAGSGWTLRMTPGSGGAAPTYACT